MKAYMLENEMKVYLLGNEDESELDKNNVCVGRK